MVKSLARLDAFARGQIVALAAKKYKAPAIRKSVQKKDGERPCARAVRDTIAKHRANPESRGKDEAGPGRDRIIDEELQKKIVKVVFKERGSAVVTVKYLKRRIPKLRSITRWTVARSLHDTVA